MGRVPSALGSDTGAPCKISGNMMSARLGTAVRGLTRGRPLPLARPAPGRYKRFLAETNDNPKPFVWTADPEKIIVDSACLGIPQGYDSDSTLIGSLYAFVRSDNGCRMPHRAARF